jgi:hypothetical protein
LHSIPCHLERFLREDFFRHTISLGLQVTLWTCEGMLGEICDATENSANEKFRAAREFDGVTLIFNLFDNG